jgi:hypothetical protein
MVAIVVVIDDCRRHAMQIEEISPQLIDPAAYMIDGIDGMEQAHRIK